MALCAAAGARRHAPQSADSARATPSRTFKHVLVPIWLLSYNYGAKAYQVIVNGYTGQIAGNRPYSAWKIFFAVVAAIIAGLIVLFLANQQ